MRTLLEVLKWALAVLYAALVLITIVYKPTTEALVITGIMGVYLVLRLWSAEQLTK